MVFLCLPIIIGFDQNLKQDEGQMPRMCFRCHNAAVVSAKKKTTFVLFCMPIFPLSSEHVWVCGICQWMVPLQGWEPPSPGLQDPSPPPPRPPRTEETLERIKVQSIPPTLSPKSTSSPSNTSDSTNNKTTSPPPTSETRTSKANISSPNRDYNQSRGQYTGLPEPTEV